MRKSTIWLLAVVMAFAFAGLLFLQVKYVSIILKKSSEQFNETVKRSMHQVSKNLELDETARYLEEDLSRDEANNYLYQNEQSSLGGGIITEKKYKMQFTNADGTVEHIEFHSESGHASLNRFLRWAAIKYLTVSLVRQRICSKR